MDIQAMQSMDWLFKKERIYLLAQFWQQRATLAEKEVSALKEQLAVANHPPSLHSDQSQPPKISSSNNSDDLTIHCRQPLEAELSTKEKEISQLVEDVHKLQSNMGKLQETTANQITRLEEELSHRRQHILRLEARLEAQRDYEEVKRQLSILRTLERSENCENGPTNDLIDAILERAKSESGASQKRNCDSSSPTDQVEPSSVSALESALESDPNVSTFCPTSLQNMEQFSSFLGEEIVANWRRSLERISQCESPPPSVPTLPLPTSKSFQLPSSPTMSSSALHTTTPAELSPQPESRKSDFSHDQQENSNDICSRKRSGSHSGSSDRELLANESVASGNETPKSIAEVNSPIPSTHRSDTVTPCKSPSSFCEAELLMSNENSPIVNNHNNNTNNCNSNNNSNAGSNHNITSGLINGLCGLNVGLNNNIPINFDMLKSQFRFDEPPRSFRFGDDPGSIVGRFGESLIPKGDPMEARLQEMLRYNMDKYSTQNLDTLNIARRVRELLSIHNVGQRLFAKYVLGLSQGTVSELLSKPKPWDKLTEKGRDSYRKMHAWACDENAILLLKSLIPKKGKEPGMPAVFARGGENDMTEERIAHILSEASQLMKPSQGMDQDSRSNDDSKSPSRQCPSPISRDGFPNRKVRKYDQDDMSQDQVIRIYQEELAKLMSRRLEDHPFPGFMFPPFFAGGGGNAPVGGGNHEDIRMTLDAYHREFAKLQNCPQNQIAQNIPALLSLQQQTGLSPANLHQSPLSNGIIQDLSLPKPERKIESKLPNGDITLSDRNEFKKESFLSNAINNNSSSHNNNINNNESTNSDAAKHSGSAFSLVKPKTETGGTSASSSPLGNSILPPEDFSPSASVSPLQRMASITNSLISQPPTTHHHSPSQRPLKAVLPPITQQQFDQFNNLNTEDIVRKVGIVVKEQLSQFSISQRLFGESVLGLSQGSVSDLLARPKPWHMLTQKGREPFIRMKMFLEDENAVHKLVASQYKIAPEKLMRTGSYGGGPSSMNSSPMSKPLPPTSCMKMPPSIMEQIKSENNPERSSNMPPHHNYLHHSSPQVHVPPPSPIFTNSTHHISPLDHFKKFNLPQTNHQVPPCNIMPQPQQHMNINALRSIGQHITPSVYEMAALTQDLDTQTITTKIKEALLANNIGQKIFGEAVLGLSQGSVSELLSKPKPWHMLSIKGREPFIRMNLWLSDSRNIERLQAMKTERREMNKRRRGSGQDNSSDTSSNDTSEFYGSVGSSPPTAAKKQRVLFSEEQKEALRLAFALDAYPSVATIEFLATELGLASRTITNWFHNHRMRLKQQSPHGSDSQLNREQQGGAFDPVQFRLLLSQRLGFNAFSLPFPNPYFTPNPEFAALMSRSILPTNEQMAGLDLSLKRDLNSEYEDDDMDNDSHIESDDSDSTPLEITPSIIESRSSRRKPAAPQWVNPDWQEEPDEIINGVCVMQTDSDEYSVERKPNLEIMKNDVEPSSKSEMEEEFEENGNEKIDENKEQKNGDSKEMKDDNRDKSPANSDTEIKDAADVGKPIKQEEKWVDE